jgi:hypothetical protein
MVRTEQEPSALSTSVCSCTVRCSRTPTSRRLLMANAVARQLPTSSSDFTARSKYLFSENWHPATIATNRTNATCRIEVSVRTPRTAYAARMPACHAILGMINPTAGRRVGRCVPGQRERRLPILPAICSSYSKGNRSALHQGRTDELTAWGGLASRVNLSRSPTELRILVRGRLAREEDELVQSRGDSSRSVGHHHGNCLRR